MSAESSSDGDIMMTGILIFESDETAEDAIGEIEDDLRYADEDDWRDIVVTQDGKLLKVVALQDVEDFLGDDEGEYDAGKVELQNIRLAMAALMISSESDFVEPQTSWTNDMTAEIIPGDTLSYWLQESTTTYYYRWDADGAVYQCADTSCP